MPKVALYTAVTVFTALAAICAVLYVLDINIVIGNNLFRPLNTVAAAILFSLLAGWMFIASLEIRRER